MNENQSVWSIILFEQEQLNIFPCVQICINSVQYCVCRCLTLQCPMPNLIHSGYEILAKNLVAIAKKFGFINHSCKDVFALMSEV